VKKDFCPDQDKNPFLREKVTIDLIIVVFPSSRGKYPAAQGENLEIFPMTIVIVLAIVESSIVLNTLLY
jgi:hypothetical protein